MTDRYDSLAPKDLIITINSLPRRFGSLVSPATSSESYRSLIDAPGPEGESLSKLMDDSMRTISVLSGAAETLIRSNNPIISAGALDADIRSGAQSSHSTLASSESAITVDCAALANLLRPLLGGDWARTAVVTGGGSISLVDLVRELVRDSITLLNRAERQSQWIKGQTVQT